MDWSRVILSTEGKSFTVYTGLGSSTLLCQHKHMSCGHSSVASVLVDW